MTDLLKCPFCGSKAKLDEHSDSAAGYQVFCLRCQTVATPVFRTEEEAVEAWNRRSGEKKI